MTDQEFNEIAADMPFAGVQPREHQNIILAVGVGGGGSNAVRHMYEQNIEGVSFAICNTDRQALINSPVPTRVMLGTGLGAGGKVDVAAAAAEESADRIRQLFTDNIKMVFVTAGMGGGTGTGAGPVVARIAREKGLLTVGIVTIPFLFEGEKKILKALEGAEELGKNVDALLMINNERLTEIYPDLNFLNAFDKADDTLSIAARSISDIITMEGRINRDFNDVNTTLRDGGTAIISTGFGEGENRVSKAIEDALHSPLLKNRDITTSKRLLFVIFFSPNAQQEFKMTESEQLTAFTSTIDKGVEIIYGVYPDASLGEKVKITILASGFEPTVREPRADMTASVSSGPTGKSEVVPVPETVRKSDAVNDNSIDNRMKDAYGEDVIEANQRERVRQRQVILTLDQLDDDAVIEALEKSVAYNRDRRSADEIKAIHTAAKTAESASPERQAGGTVGTINFLE